MQFNKDPTVKKISREADASETHVYGCKGFVEGHRCFYKRTPSSSLTLQQFETYAVERLKVLKAVELAALTRGSSNVEQQVLQEALSARLKELGWDFLSKLTDKRLTDQDEEKDLLSHHILRLAYCQSEAKRTWFVNQEADLLAHRMRCSASLLNSILEHTQLRSAPVPLDELKGLIRESDIRQQANRVYYKVDFEEVLQLVSARKVVLSGGYAYLPESELFTFVLNKYKLYLKEQLARACKHLPEMDEDHRILKLLRALSDGDLGDAFTTSKAVNGHVSADMLDSLSQQSFPLCMQVLHHHLRSAHHLKHEGRMQYGLFLKGIGLPLEESLKFWKQEFVKGGTDPDKFDKNYGYNIRHNYGKEGKRTDYTPHSCMKIISRADPKGDECHGCPYKHSDEAALRQMLDRMKLSTASKEEIVGLKKQGHFQVACMALFKATHKNEALKMGLQHPNQYFEESQTILKGNQAPEKPANNKSITGEVVGKALPRQPNIKQELATEENMDIFQEEIVESMD